MTGKPARRIEVQKGGLSAKDDFKTKEVNGLFDLMQALNGNFFNGRPTEHENAQILKAQATKAGGLPASSGKLMTVRQYSKQCAFDQYSQHRRESS